MHSQLYKGNWGVAIISGKCKGHQATALGSSSWTSFQCPRVSSLRAGMESALVPSVSSASAEQLEREREREREPPVAEALEEELDDHLPTSS